MPRNIELKARLRDLASAQAIAERITGDGPEVQRQTDTYFRCRNGRLKLREIDGGPAQLVAYERPDVAESKGSDYLLVPVADPRGLKQALTSTIGVLTVVRKTRRIYLSKNVRIHLDEVEGLGTFLEFEAVLSTEIDDQAGCSQLDDLQRLFAIMRGDLLTGSYSDMLVPPEQ